MPCWRRLRDWQAAGVWQQLHEILLAELNAADQIDWSRAATDSSFVRALGGGERTGPSPVDRRKKGSKPIPRPPPRATSIPLAPPRFHRHLLADRAHSVAPFWDQAQLTVAQGLECADFSSANSCSVRVLSVLEAISHYREQPGSLVFNLVFKGSMSRPPKSVTVREINRFPTAECPRRAPAFAGTVIGRV